MANSWRRERWDSLRLLRRTGRPDCPGIPTKASDPDGYMTMREVVEFISRYADVTAAPVRTHTTVTSVSVTDSGYHVTTNRGVSSAAPWCWRPAPATVPSVPSLRRRCHHDSVLDAFRLPQPGPSARRRRAGRGRVGDGRAARRRDPPVGPAVVLSVGEHVRLPRTYRGRDVLWWMDASGVWNQRYDEIDDLTRARRLPSPQLVGTPERTTLDLNALSDARRRARRPACRGP